MPNQARVRDGFVPSTACECGRAKYAYSYKCMPCARANRAQRPDLQPIRQATEVELAWAAGFYEGEGYVGGTRGFRVSAFQNETWPLDRMREYFGGSVRPSQAGYLWFLSGNLARVAMEAMLPHLSPRRVEQYLAALRKVEEPRAQKPS